jgi:hypothetical protein
VHKNYDEMPNLFTVERVLLGNLNGTSVVDWRALMVGLLELPVARQHQLVTAATHLQEGTFCKMHVWMDSAFATGLRRPAPMCP